MSFLEKSKMKGIRHEISKYGPQIRDHEFESNFLVPRDGGAGHTFL